MAKRSDFERVERDYYRTFDPRAGDALKPFIELGQQYIEPFAGAGDLVDQLAWANCSHESDIEPQPAKNGRYIMKLDAFNLQSGHILRNPIMITNCPWDRKIFHKAIEHFAPMLPSWFLIDSNWLNTKQSAPYVKKYLTDIVPIGRLKWIEGTTMSGKDDCSWLRFSKDKELDYAKFHGR